MATLPHAIGKGSPKAAQIQEFGKQIPAVAARGVDPWRGSKPGPFLQSTCYTVQLRARPGHSSASPTPPGAHRSWVVSPTLHRGLRGYFVEKLNPETDAQILCAYATRVPLCVHTHTHTCSDTQTHIHTYTHSHVHTPTHARNTPTFTYITHLHTYMCSHAHTHVHTHSHMLIRVHTRALSLTHPHTCVLTLTHIHAHAHSAPAPGQLRTDHLALLIYHRTSSWGRKSGCLLVTLSFSPQPQEGHSQGGSRSQL